MSTINAYIHFKDNCREAMSFYHDCLGGELSLQVVKDSPMAAMMAPDMQDLILHASLENDDLTLLGSEMPNEDAGTNAHSISLMLNCDSKEEMLIKFEKLSAGGKVTYPPHEFFAGIMGNITDRFGFKWAVFTAEK